MRQLVRVVARGAALCLASSLACGPGAPDTPVDGWTEARAALVDGESCYAQLADYCLKDQALIDAAIQAALDARFDGVMPGGARDVEDVIRSARGRYKTASREPAQLEQIAALVQARYDAPVVDASDPELVNVDLGALPGTLAVRGRSPTIVLSDSPLIEAFWWRADEAGRVLARYAREHPEKPVVRAELRIPKGTGSDKHLAYRYFREHNRVAFGEVGEDSVYVTAEIPGGIEAMAAGALELGHGARSLCSRPRSGPSSSWCPWRDRYAEAQREAARARRRDASRGAAK